MASNPPRRHSKSPHAIAPSAASALNAAVEKHRTGAIREAIDAYRAIVARWPRYGDAHNLLGLALHQAGANTDALAALDRAIAIDDRHPDYRNHRGIVLLALGRNDAAIADFRRAIAAQPGHARALANLGNALKATGDAGGAMDQYRRAIEADPAYAEAWFNLGNVQREVGDPAGAKESYRKALAINPRLAAAYANIGGLLLAEEDAAGARQAFEAALAAAGERPSFLYGLAGACERLGDTTAAEAAYRRLLAIAPDHADGLNNLGALLVLRDDADGAMALFQQALSSAPQHERAAYNLGKLHARRASVDEAARYFMFVRSLENASPERLTRLGLAFQSIDRDDDAIDCFRSALEARPDDLDLHEYLGTLLREKHDSMTALDHLEYVFDQGRDTAHLRQELGLVQIALGRPMVAIAHMRAAIERAPDELAHRSSYLMMRNYDDSLTPDELFAEHCAQMAPFAGPMPPRPRHARAPGGRLRIGYVSPDFRMHSCSNFLLPPLAAHDRDRVEVFCYANVRRPDSVTETLAGLADHWRDIRPLDDAAADALIVADGIDVLIDLAGHTADNRLGLFLRKPAARQISWLGYPNTVGVPAIDIRLTDDIADPSPAADARHVERLVRIADGFLAYRPRLETPDVAPGPVLRDEPPRFGCFNNACKLSDRTVELWADLLAAVPDATLLLRAEQFRYDVIRDEFRQRFAARGVDPHRIVFPAFENRLLDALAGHAEIDVALDPTPYGGTTTTCEALWMGVPVVTLAGDRHAARVGASLLTHCGLGDLVTGTGADYVRIAGDLVRDRDRLSDLRASLRDRLSSSPVGDGRRMAAAIEAACLDAVAEA